jgi:hypothetical protein
MLNRERQWQMKPWDESAGYDCMTPGVEIVDAAGHTVCVIDAKDYGWNTPGLGYGVAEHRERVHRQVYDTAASIVRNHNEGRARMMRPVRVGMRTRTKDRGRRPLRSPRLTR